jgi:ribosome-associated toxin RatA of RatAB toxin-antitoxin module
MSDSHHQDALGPMPTDRLMRTVDERIVRAAPRVIFAIAAHVERWPEYLRHYRDVHFETRDGADGGIVAMSANRPFGAVNWPTWWVSVMHVDSARPAIRFRHVRGITTGMDVEWTFDEIAEGTLVRIVHVWNGPSWPLISTLAARWVIGPVFVHGIASRTLAGLAKVAERSQEWRVHAEL